MTRIAKPKHSSLEDIVREEPPGYWALQDAKARFSELVRRVKEQGPQRVTVHGREEVVILAADEFRRLQGNRSGADLVAALQSCPHPEQLRLAASRPLRVKKGVKL
jgi:prevent-host-death family protein